MGDGRNEFTADVLTVARRLPRFPRLITVAEINPLANGINGSASTSSVLAQLRSLGYIQLASEKKALPKSYSHFRLSLAAIA